MTEATLFIGGVASGKSTAIGVVGFTAGWLGLSMGSVARSVYDEAETNQSLSRWAGQRKGDDPAWCAKELVKQIDNHEDDYSKVAIEGIRGPEEVSVFENYFDRVNVVWLWAPFYTRMNRAMARGRDDTEEPADFFERDQREREWGLHQLTHPTNYDYFIPNTGTVEQFRSDIQSYLEGKTMPRYAPWHN